MAVRGRDSDRRARDAAPAHVADPRLRAARDGALRGEAHPRLGAPVHRHGGDRGRRVRGAPARRLHHQHASRARPLHRQGPRPRPDDGRDHRARGRLLPRPRRQHAHHRDRAGDARAPTRSSRGSSRSPSAPPTASSSRARDTVVVCFFGDGAANQGILHEACNLAAVLDAQVVFVCENNQWAISTAASASTRIADIADRAAGYGFPGVVVGRQRRRRRCSAVDRDGRRARPLRRRPDADRGEDLPHDAALGRDEDRPPPGRRAGRAGVRAIPILQARPRVLHDAGVAEARLEEIAERARAEIESAVEFALASPRPDAAAALEDVYAPSDWNAGGTARMSAERELTMAEALNEALHARDGARPARVRDRRGHRARSAGSSRSRPACSTRFGAAARDRRADLGGGTGRRGRRRRRWSAPAPSSSCRSPTSSR